MSMMHNHVQKGGLCIRHGATIKLCSSEGFTIKAQNGGVCFRQGATVKLYAAVKGARIVS